MKIICADALQWMAQNDLKGAAIVTSLPDANEMELNIEQWKIWFKGAAAQCMALTEDSCSTIFYQTDRKYDGGIESKASLLFEAAVAAGVRCLFHKIALRVSPNAITLFRPGYTHIMAFSKEERIGKVPFPDVLAAGPQAYDNATGEYAARLMIEFAIRNGRKIIIDPFCGRGTIPRIADEMDLEAIGIDIDPEQCKIARDGFVMELKT